ncbi:hypothetical protein D3C81_2026580 [compost metagenome]
MLPTAYGIQRHGPGRGRDSGDRDTGANANTPDSLFEVSGKALLQTRMLHRRQGGLTRTVGDTDWNLKRLEELGPEQLVWRLQAKFFLAGNVG